MLIAQAKRQENIVEYILYMFQLQDMLRAIKFDEEYIMYNIVHNMSADEEVRKDIMQWYRELITSMKKEGLETSGNTSELNGVISELVLLNGMLINQLKDQKYQQLYDAAQPFVEEFRAKAKNTKASEIMVCLNALYAKLLLKLKKQEISEESEEAFKAFAMQLAYLSKKYKDMYSGKLSYSMN